MANLQETCGSTSLAPDGRSGRAKFHLGLNPGGGISSTPEVEFGQCSGPASARSGSFLRSDRGWAPEYAARLADSSSEKYLGCFWLPEAKRCAGRIDDNAKPAVIHYFCHVSHDRCAKRFCLLGRCGDVIDLDVS